VLHRHHKLLTLLADTICSMLHVASLHWHPSWANPAAPHFSASHLPPRGSQMRSKNARSIGSDTSSSGPRYQ
jgi:hypothetical protein